MSGLPILFLTNSFLNKKPVPIEQALFNNSNSFSLADSQSYNEVRDSLFVQVPDA